MSISAATGVSYEKLVQVQWSKPIDRFVDHYFGCSSMSSRIIVQPRLSISGPLGALKQHSIRSLDSCVSRNLPPSPPPPPAKACSIFPTEVHNSKQNAIALKEMNILRVNYLWEKDTSTLAYSCWKIERSRHRMSRKGACEPIKTVRFCTNGRKTNLYPNPGTCDCLPRLQCVRAIKYKDIYQFWCTCGQGRK